MGNKKPPGWRSFQWGDMQFPNPLAPAGGVDKSARQLRAWWALGAGFIEIGTVTPLPQKPNKGSILRRNLKEKALWNYMGFPGDGLKAVCGRLKQLNNRPRWTPIFANIGKNRDTALDKAHEDYIQCISELYPYVDAFVINISSPNTENLRNLSTPSHLRILLSAINSYLFSMKKRKPVFVKWSPDMDEKDFLNALDQAGECGVEGHIICNSSQVLGRNLQGAFPKYGGVSGRPLTAIAREKLILAHNHLSFDRKKYLLVSSGGVLTPKDVFERLDMGADLVQVYSALIFDGPWFLLKTKHAFKEL